MASDFKNAEEWTVQVAPLKKLGLRVIGRGRGSFHKNPDGTPIVFTGLRMGITREEWHERGRHSGSAAGSSWLDMVASSVLESRGGPGPS